MQDPEKMAAAELAFALGKMTRRALDHSGEAVDRPALARFANNLLEAGHEKIATDVLMIFVAGFEEGDPPERRAGLAER